MIETTNSNIDGVLSSEQKYEKLNKKMKVMNNRIALLEATLLQNMANPTTGGGTNFNTSATRVDVDDSSATTNNQVDDGMVDNHSHYRKRTLV